MTHACDECGKDLEKTYFCSDAHRMSYRRRGGPRSVAEKPVESVESVESVENVESDKPTNFMEEMRRKTAEILKKPPTPVFPIFVPRGPQPPPPEKFFEEETITID